MRPDFVYRFPYGAYPSYRWGYPEPPYTNPFPPPESAVASSQAYGGVEFELGPHDAMVIVDGFSAGRVSDLREGKHLELVPGAHHIELQAPGFEPLTFDVHIQSGRTIRFRSTMRPL
jgi:hypothetical protein